MPSFTREQVLAYRVAAQGLHRTERAPADLAVLDLGVQESLGAQAWPAFAARLPATRGADPRAGEDGLVLAWSVRGAPHWHRRADLPRLAGALYPLSAPDAARRLGGAGARLTKRGLNGLEIFEAGVAAIRDVVRDAMTKGAASGAVTGAGPDVISEYCRACKVVHVSEMVLRLGSLQAGLELDPDTSPPVLLPSFTPQRPNRSATAELISGYLALLGPATVSDAAGHLDARPADVKALTLAGLVEVQVEGRSALLPEECLDAVGAAPPPSLVRLLGPFDPYLQARDRDLIVPDRAVHKVLWPILGRPGVLFADGEVVGTWRPKTAGRRLELTVEAFAPLPASVWAAVEDEATHLATVRGAADVRVNRVT